MRFIGEDPEREGLRDTPRRIVKSWGELFGGYQMDPRQILARDFDQDGYGSMVLLNHIPVFSTCEHHFLPFIGEACVAYIPNGRVVGISKLARLVECFSRRLQIQERLTNQIADALEEAIRPKGCAVYIKAKHLCMMARGVRLSNPLMETSVLRGAFLKMQKTREEFYQICMRPE